MGSRLSNTIVKRSPATIQLCSILTNIRAIIEPSPVLPSLRAHRISMDILLRICLVLQRTITIIQSPGNAILASEIGASLTYMPTLGSRAVGQAPPGVCPMRLQHVSGHPHYGSYQESTYPPGHEASQHYRFPPGGGFTSQDPLQRAWQMNQYVSFQSSQVRSPSIGFRGWTPYAPNKSRENE